MIFKNFFKLVVLFFPLFLISCARTDLNPVIFRGSEIIKQQPLKTSKLFIPSSFPRKISIKQGDTLFRISRKYAVALRKLIEINGLKAPYIIKKGQFLKIPGVRFHIAQVDETIYGIARAHGVRMRSLVKINQLAPPYKIQRGDRLQIPYSKGVSKRVPRGTKKTESQIQNKIEKKDLKFNKKLGSRNSFGKKDLKTGPKILLRPTVNSSLAKINTPKFLWPVAGRIIVSFGPRKNGFYNDGINIAAKHGTSVRAVGKGIVAYVGNQLQGFGNLLLIRHPEGWMSAYAHSSIVLVRRGSAVQRGQVIAEIGQTGNVGRPQLHFELRRGDKAVDPRQFLTRYSFLSIKNLLAFRAFQPSLV